MISYDSTPLSSLTQESRNLLSLLLNNRKILPSDGPEKLPRDWRGLASLVNISAELASSIDGSRDKTALVLDIWQQRENRASVGQLLDYLQKIDRYDIYDDLLELSQEGRLLESSSSQVAVARTVPPLLEERDDLLTFDDVSHGCPQLYHAYILYAREDREFVNEMVARLSANGFRLCMADDLLPGHITQFGPISRLISERCHRIIIVASPEFLSSPANTFFMDYAQAVGIETNTRKIIPCMYRKCLLPEHLRYYHPLYYVPPGQKAVYDFWQKLSQTLELVNLRREPVAIAQSSHNPTLSTLRITEVSASQSTSEPVNGFIHFNKTPQRPQTDFLSISNNTPTKSVSECDLNHPLLSNSSKEIVEDSKSLSNVSEISEKRKKGKGWFKKTINTLKGKKHKNKQAVMVEA